jgi:serine phosphatase RsbU (regulator of sigma subunit)
MFGSDRLVTMLMRGTRCGPELLDDILDEVTAFTGSSTHQDDVTLLTLELEKG